MIKIWSNKITEFNLDIIFNLVKLENQLLIARNPMYLWIRQVLLLLSLLMTVIKLVFSLLLLLKSKVFATFNPLSANFKTFIHFKQGFLIVYKAIHWAMSAFIVHYIELLIQESIKLELSIAQSFIQHVQNFLVHVINLAFVFGNLEELAHFLMVFVVRFSEVNLKLFL